MSEENQIDVKISAETSGLTEGLNKASGTVKDSTGKINDSMKTMGDAAKKSEADFKDAAKGIEAQTKEMQHTFAEMKEQIHSKLEGISKGLEMVGKSFAIALGIMKGGQMFKEFISDAAQATKEASMMQKQMGLTAEDAGAMVDVIKKNAMSVEDFAGTMQKLQFHIAANGEAFEKHGIAIHDNQGKLLSMSQILFNSQEYLGKFTEGVSRNMEATNLFGKDIENLGKVMLVTKDAVEETRKEMDEMGIAITQKNIDAFKNYKKQINGLNLAFEGFKEQIGMQIIPYLAQMGEVFNQGASKVGDLARVIGDVAGGAFALLATAVSSISDIFVVLMESVDAITTEFANFFSDTTSGAESNSKEMTDWGDVLGQTFKFIQKMIIGVGETVTLLIQIFTSLNNVIFEIFGSITRIIYESASTIIGIVKSIWDAIANRSFAPIVNNFKNGFSAIEKVAENSATRVKEIMSGAMNSIDASLNKAADKMNVIDNPTTKEAKKKAAGGNLDSSGHWKDKSGGGGGADKMDKAALQLAKAESEARIAILKAEHATETQMLEEAMSRNLVSFKDYADKQLSITRDETQKEIELKNVELAAAQKIAQKTAANDPNHLAALGQIAKIKAEITVLTEQQLAKEDAIRFKLEEQKRAFDSQVLSMRVKLADATGSHDLESRFALIDDTWKKTLDRMIAEGDVAGQEMVNNLVNVEKLKVRIDESEKEIALFETRRKITQAQMDKAVADGSMNEFEAKQKTIALNEQIISQEIELKNAELDRMKASGVASAQEIANKELEIAELEKMKTATDDVAAGVNKGMQSGFQNFFKDILSGTKSVKNAFKDMCASILASMNDIIAKKLSEQLMASLFGSDGFNFGKAVSGGMSGGSGGGIFGGLMNSFSGFFGGFGSGGAASAGASVGALEGGAAFAGFFADGGNIGAGSFAVVGENGPEVIKMPSSQSGTVIPNDKLGSGTTIHMNISTPDSNSFRKSMGQIQAEAMFALGKGRARYS